MAGPCSVCGRDLAYHSADELETCRDYSLERHRQVLEGMCHA